MKKIIGMAIPALGLLSGVCLAEDAVELKTDTDRINYAVGYRLGADFKRQDVEVNGAVLLKAIEDAVSGGKPMMDAQEQRATLVTLQQRMAAAQKEKQTNQGAENLEKGKAFLAENGKKEGVTTLPSGLQYKELTAGEGKSPGATDSVTVHYRGMLIDGKEFDSSHKRNKPATFQLNRVIKGWGEGLQLMQEGDKWELYIPSELAYGSRGAGNRIPANSALVFEVELISVNTTEAAEK